MKIDEILEKLSDNHDHAEWNCYDHEDEISEAKQSIKQLILERLPKGYLGQSFNGMVNINVVGVETVKQVINDIFDGRE